MIQSIGIKQAVLFLWQKTLYIRIAFGVLILMFLTTVNKVNSHEIGLAWDRISGNCWIQSPGIHISSPFVLVSNIDIRTTRVCVESSTRSGACKLVQFDRRYVGDFYDLEGFRYYWFDNRFSFNFGYKEEYRGFRDILRGYAFAPNRATDYKFIKILEEY